jgi:hypothetical protein
MLRICLVSTNFITAHVPFQGQSSECCHYALLITSEQWRKSGLKSGGGGRIHGERLKF